VRAHCTWSSVHIALASSKCHRRVTRISRLVGTEEGSARAVSAPLKANRLAVPRIALISRSPSEMGTMIWAVSERDWPSRVMLQIFVASTPHDERSTGTSSSCKSCSAVARNVRLPISIRRPASAPSTPPIGSAPAEAAAPLKWFCTPFIVDRGCKQKLGLAMDGGARRGYCSHEQKVSHLCGSIAAKRAKGGLTRDAAGGGGSGGVGDPPDSCVRVLHCSHQFHLGYLSTWRRTTSNYVYAPFVYCIRSDRLRVPQGASETMQRGGSRLLWSGLGLTLVLVLA